MDRTILHCDLNNFYASVELKRYPEYRDKPLAVCGDPQARHGIILAKNTAAKDFGVSTGEAVWISLKKCPGLVLVPPHFEDYVVYSKEVFSIYTGFTDKVESFGLDECWLDVTGSRRLFGSGSEIADSIRALIKERTGLTASVGVSFTKVLAKLGSDLKKPDATVVLDRENYMRLIGNLSPAEFIMIGNRTAQKLKSLGIDTIAKLATADRGILRQKFGVIGDRMIDAALGIERDTVKNYYDTHLPKSVSNGTTTPRDITCEEDAKIVIYALCDHIAVRLRKYGLIAEGVGLSLKDTALHTQSIQCRLEDATSNATDLAAAAMRLLKRLHSFPQPLRAITVAAIRLGDASARQLSFGSCDVEREEKLERSLDKIRGKYGYRAVRRGHNLDTDIVGNLHEEDGFHPFQR